MYPFRIVWVFIDFFCITILKLEFPTEQKMLYFYVEKKVLRKSDGKMCKIRIYTYNSSFSMRNDLKANCWTLYHITSNKIVAIYKVNFI